MNKSPQSNFSLFAANNTKIPAYGMVRKELNLDLPKSLSSPLHVVPKSDSTVRHVGDYRQLNSVTEFDSYPMPYLNDFAHALHGKKGLKAFKLVFSEAITAFQRCKQALADAALLAHPSPSAPLALHVDASDYAIGCALHQVVDSELQPLAFFSRKLTSSEKSYSAYDRELLAIYSAIPHFRYMLEARDFTVFTDHKPLTYAFRQKSDKCSPRQIRHLDFISVHHKYCTHSRI
ncbi:retrovirus-related Pol polyprotein from transposon 17.6 [Trichonephila clavipes]|nr:retrovirus-related Pol polyprotein from transposon 17.6 [Trichonephila clavipes]